MSRWAILGIGAGVAALFGCAALFLLSAVVSYQPSGGNEFLCAFGDSNACDQLQQAQNQHVLLIGLLAVAVILCVVSLIVAGIVALALPREQPQPMLLVYAPPPPAPAPAAPLPPTQRLTPSSPIPPPWSAPTQHP